MAARRAGRRTRTKKEIKEQVLRTLEIEFESLRRVIRTASKAHLKAMEEERRIAKVIANLTERQGQLEHAIYVLKEELL